MMRSCRGCTCLVAEEDALLPHTGYYTVKENWFALLFKRLQEMLSSHFMICHSISAIDPAPPGAAILVARV
jgi:hypothetical protein